MPEPRTLTDALNLKEVLAMIDRLLARSYPDDDLLELKADDDHVTVLTECGRTFRIDIKIARLAA